MLLHFCLIFYATRTSVSNINNWLQYRALFFFREKKRQILKSDPCPVHFAKFVTSLCLAEPRVNIFFIDKSAPFQYSGSI